MSREDLLEALAKHIEKIDEMLAYMSNSEALATLMLAKSQALQVYVTALK